MRFVQLIVFFSLGVTFVFAQEIRVDIDNDTQLRAVGENLGCTSYNSVANITCKTDVPTTSPENTGFWSSCIERSCELKILVGAIGDGNRVPIRMEVLSYVNGFNPQIRASYKVRPSGIPMNLYPRIQATNGWETTNIHILPEFGLTTDSEIYLLLESETFYSEVDVLDKITFVYAD